MSEIGLYCCGGGGSNIGLRFLVNAGVSEVGFGTLYPYFIDLSDSNIRNKKLDLGEKLYLFEGKDGSGGVRTTNIQEVMEYKNDILLKMPPKQFNIILHTAGGGSGSVIAPVLASELLSRGENVIVLAIGDTSSEKEVKNTANTLRSYDKIANTREKPVFCMYFENTGSEPRGNIDNKVAIAIVYLSIFFSGQNGELDSKDLESFLNYSNVVEGGMPNTLTQLEFISGAVKPTKNTTIPAIVTLTSEQVDGTPGIPVKFRTNGFINQAACKAFPEDVKLPIRMAAVVGYYQPIIEKLESELSNAAATFGAVVQKPLFDDKKHTTMGDIIV